jgi:hypothetical protein
MKDENGNEYECNVQGCTRKSEFWLEGNMPRLNLGPICKMCLDALSTGISPHTKVPVQQLPRRAGS